MSDGPLLSIPFSALYDSSGKRLVERFAISSAISLGSLTWSSSTKPAAHTLLCTVDPTGARPERFASLTRGGMGALKYAREEARRITSLFPGAVGMAGPEAKEAAVKQAMPSFSILHFATHGILDTQEGMRSWLLLAEEPATSREDGRLEAREIAGMPVRQPRVPPEAERG